MSVHLRPVSNLESLHQHPHNNSQMIYEVQVVTELTNSESGDGLLLFRLESRFYCCLAEKTVSTQAKNITRNKKRKRESSAYHPTQVLNLFSMLVFSSHNSLTRDGVAVATSKRRIVFRAF